MDGKILYPIIVRNSFRKMGTDIDLQIVVNNQSEYLKANSDLLFAQNLYDEYEKIFSRFDKESELSYLNKSLNSKQNISEEMREVIELSLDYYKQCNRIFDPRIIQILEDNGYSQTFEEIDKTDVVHDRAYDANLDLENDLKLFDDGAIIHKRMDFSGLVKGWVTDKIADFFKQQNWKNFLVDSGGDIFFAGRDVNGKPWYIDIEGISAEKILLRLENKAIATSGIGRRKWEKDGKRFHHLINPQKPNVFSFDINSVTAISRDVTEADVLAKTIFILGKEMGMKFAKEKNIACVILSYNGSAWVSPEIKRHLYEKSV